MSDPHHNQPTKGDTVQSEGAGQASSSTANSAANGDFSSAMARLEKALSEVVSEATGQVSERATTLLNDTSRRLESELRLRRSADAQDTAARRQQRGARSRRERHRLADRSEQVNPRSGRLYRDPQHKKIGGVCAGFARYLGFETWAVRLATAAAFVFVPGVVFPAYWIAYFLMDKPGQALDTEASETYAGQTAQTSAEGAGTAPRAIALRLSASRSLRHTAADLTQAELRLRRLESFVTSKQYHLHRELAKIDGSATT